VGLDGVCENVDIGQKGPDQRKTVQLVRTTYIVVNYKYRGTCTTVDGRKRYGETDGKRERERKAELTFTIDIEIGRVISLKYYD
jgi:hypothetical protein